jgi:iron-sulfur cluster repair protein YtfE (RIC family)
MTCQTRHSPPSEDNLKDIDTRRGWPDDLCGLLKQHPRSAWRTHGTPMTDFWLQQHDSFRNQCAALQAATDDFRAGQTAPDEFCLWVAPRLHGFIGHLHGHHQVEDFHYFPAFRAAEQQLAAGFDVLANDHQVIHSGIDELVRTTNEFIAAVRNPAAKDSRHHVGDRYVAASELLYKRLVRHLNDEEDLVIPVMLARGH